MTKKDYIFILWSPVIGDEETVGFIQLASTVYLVAARNRQWRNIGFIYFVVARNRQRRNWLIYYLWLPVIGNEETHSYIYFVVARNR